MAKLKELLEAWFGEKLLMSKEGPLSLEGFCPAQVERVLLGFGYVQEDIETNGWQHDFWIYYTPPNESLPPVMVCGCWWDGLITIKIRK